MNVLRENKLRYLPSSLASLHVLRTLDVSYNLLSAAEDHVFQLTSLQYLVFSGNRFDMFEIFHHIQTYYSGYGQFLQLFPA